MRLHDVPGLGALLAPDALGAIACRTLGAEARPVRAILFDKSDGNNWALGWHQDRTIAVTARVDTSGFGPWSVKAGLLHVEPPFAVIEAMVTMRIHLDAVPADNAPLLIAPGSHRLGRVPEAEIAGAVERCGTAMCLADAGDVWLYATPILHASAAASGHAHRRVLQVDFSAGTLPHGLEWLGIG
ncbi:phytanoyl-CoA dioxygenase family protein [Sphingomonas sp. CJ20]